MGVMSRIGLTSRFPFEEVFLLHIICVSSIKYCIALHCIVLYITFYPTAVWVIIYKLFNIIQVGQFSIVSKVIRQSLRFWFCYGLRLAE